jgi:hypothetical protein
MTHQLEMNLASVSANGQSDAVAAGRMCRQEVKEGHVLLPRTEVVGGKTVCHGTANGLHRLVHRDISGRFLGGVAERAEDPVRVPLPEGVAAEVSGIQTWSRVPNHSARDTHYIP